MAFKVKLLPIVHLDLRNAKKWYKERNGELADNFKAEVNKEIDYICEHPHHYQKKYKELRQSLVTRFRYAIFYLIDEEQKRIIVFGVLHRSRDPEIVGSRLKL